MAYRDIILSKTIDYVKEKKLSVSGRGAIAMIDCPYCHFQKSAQFIQAIGQIKCVHCQTSFNLIDLVRFTENKLNDSEEDILNYVRDILKIEVQTTADAESLEKLLKSYEDRKWALVPCQKKGKAPVQAEWQKKENRKASEWFYWVSSGLNLGVRTGQVSNLTIIDFDLLTKQEKADLFKDETSKERKTEILTKKVIPEEIRKLLGDTLVQESHGGFHYFYKYIDLPKTAINDSGIHIDLENEGGQVVIAPSNQVGVEEEYEENGEKKKRIVGYAGRKFINDNPVIPMPDDLVSWLKERIKPGSKTTSDDSGKPDVIKVPEDFKVKDLQSNRNNTLTSLGGIFRQEMNLKQTAFVLNVLNKHVLTDPLPKEEILHILEGLDKYIGADDNTLANDIIAYLKDTDTATKPEIEAAVFGQRTTSENKKRFDRTLNDLVRDEKIMKKNSREYKILKDMEWKTDLLSVGMPVNFKVPYFNDCACFNWGDNILIGGTTKAGKTHLCMNILKRLVQQGIKPGYFFNENGSRFAKIALQLGLTPGDFEYVRCSNPAEIIMKKPNSVYIYDWYRPTDFTKTADDFDKIAEKLDRTQSLMFTFAQLRDGNAKAGNENEWFAKDQIRQFVALSAKYMYDDNEGVNTYFDVNDIRDSKTGQKRIKIPCQYQKQTKEILLQEEIDKMKEVK